MSAEYTFDRVASFEVRGIINGEIPLNNWHSVRVYRTVLNGEAAYSVHYDIDHYYFNEQGELVQGPKTSEQDDFEDGASADAKFQHQCLKAFTNVMTNRDKSY